MKVFAAAVNCMDGMAQEPVIRYLKTHYNVDYVDMITESGPEKVIAEDTDKYKLNSIKQRLDISDKIHGCKIILVAGHFECSGNAVDKGTHIAQILNAAATIREWYPDAQIIPVWINKEGVVEPL